MYIFRRDLGNSYIPGSDPTEKDDNNGPIDYGKPGPHRFIGIAMAVGLIFLAVIVYLIFGKRPRRALGKYCQCLGGRKDEDVVEGADMTQVSVGLEAVSSPSYSSEEKPHFFRTSISGAQVDAKKRWSNRSRSRSHSHSRSRHGSRLSIEPPNQYVTTGTGNVEVEWEVYHNNKDNEVSDLVEKLFLSSRLDQSNFLGSNRSKARSSEATASISALKR